MSEKTKAELRKEKYEQFRKVISTFYGETLLVSQQSLEALDSRIHRVGGRLARLHRERDGLYQRMYRNAGLDINNMIFDTAFPDEITTMEYVNNGLVVHTTDISLSMEIPALGSLVEIPVGEFRIEIKWDTGETGVANTRVIARNKTHPHPSGSDHPHVRNGNICWGDLGEAVVQKMATNSISELIDLTLMLLMSYNPGSAFTSLLNGWGHRLPDNKKICVRCIRPINVVRVGSRDIRCTCAPQTVQDVQQHTPATPTVQATHFATAVEQLIRAHGDVQQGIAIQLAGAAPITA